MSYWGKDKKKKKSGVGSTGGDTVNKKQQSSKQEKQKVMEVITKSGSPPRKQRETSKRIEPQSPSSPMKQHELDMPLEFGQGINYNENESSFRTFLIQTKTLTWKNYCLFTRKYQVLAFLLITPFFVTYLLNVMVSIGDTLSQMGYTDGTIAPIDTVERCITGRELEMLDWIKQSIGLYVDTSYVDEGCMTVGYGFLGDYTDVNAPQYKRYHRLMEIFAKQNEFKMETDVKALTAGKQKDIYEYLEVNQNKTKYAIMFCHEHWEEELEINTLESEGDVHNVSASLEERSRTKKKKLKWYMPCQFENKDHGEKDMIAYYMLYNMSHAPSNMYTAIDKPMEVDLNLLSLKRAMDNAVLELKAEETGLGYIPKINLTYQHYPYVPDRIFRNIDPISMYGSMYLIVVPLSVFMVVFEELMREKVDNLRRGMQLLGTLDSAYWASWIITAFFMNLLITTEMIIIGNYANFNCFTKTPIEINFFLYFITTQSFIIMSFFFSTIVTTRSQAFSVNFSVVLTSMVMNLALSEPTVLKKVFFNLDMPNWVRFISYIFYFNPCFAFGKIFGDINHVVTARFDPQSLNWINTSEKFEYKHMFQYQEGEFFSKDRYRVVPMVDTIWTFFYNILFYGVLAWYMDNILSQNRGVPRPWYFPFTLSFWFSFLEQQNTNVQIDELHKSDKPNDTYNIEKNAIIKDEKKSKRRKYFDGLRVMGLSKTYMSIDTTKIEALKNVYFEICKGELLGVMGHNGAGKSTLINVLCGLISKNGGNARVSDLNIEDDLVKIRKQMGVVSQFDVLWDELTGVEHMYLIQTLKRVDVPNFDKLVEQRLKDVGLFESGHLMVGKYSGGMRRRISVALATMGNPSVILMDEPTTGMDPVSRRHVWNLIQRLKLEKTIIMSTHAMEEAELLSDKLIVLNQGEVRCVGTPQQLKNMHGKGYRVSMISEKQNVEKVRQIVQQIVPSSQFLESSGESGGMVFNVPMSNVKELGPIFSIMNKMVQKGNNKANAEESQQEKLVSQMKMSEQEKSMTKLRSLVTDVGVSQTTLEEVFMAVTSH